MADKKISALPSVVLLSGTELVPIVQGGVTVKVTTQLIASLSPAYTGSNGITLTANNFTNDLITGKTGGQTIVGGTAVTDYLAYKGTTGNGTPTSVAHQFLVGNNGATTAMSIYNDGGTTVNRLGINKANPVYFLDILSDSQTGTEAISFRYHAGATTGSPQIFFEKARGTLATPTALLSGDDIGYLSWRGHTGSAFTGTRASIMVEASENWSPTATGTQMNFSVVTNGTTAVLNAARILNDGNLHLLNSTSRLYMGSTAASNDNYKLYGDSGTTILNANSSVLIRTGNNSYNNAIFNTTSTLFTCSTIGSGANTNFTFTVPANTNQTATTNIPNFKITGASKQWATGTVANQYWNYLSANTAAFVGASTITNSYGLFVEAATAGANATITNNYAAGFSGNISLEGGNRIINASNSLELIHGTGSNFRVYTGATLRIDMSPTVSAYYNGTATSGAISGFIWTHSANTNQTASTEIPGYLYNSYSRQWATGNITTQRERYYKTVTYTAVGASVITNAYGAYFEAPTASTNVTITNNYAAGFSGNVNIIGTPYVSGVAGVDGTFTTVDLKTVTVTKGIITSII